MGQHESDDACQIPGALTMKVRFTSYGDRPAVEFKCLGCNEMHFVTTDAPVGWEFNGDFNKPTIRPSIFVNQGQRSPEDHACHSFVTDGQIQYLTDCTHALAGQTVELPDLTPSIHID